MKISIPVDITFYTSEGGNYYLNGNSDPIIDNEIFKTYGDVYFELFAKPNDGFIFYGRMFNGTLKSTDNPINTTCATNTDVRPFFITEDDAVFSNSGSLFTDLNAAVENATNKNDKTVLLIRSGTINGGTENSIAEYTVKSGVTLLIPDNAENKMFLGTDDLPLYIGTHVKPTPYKTLIIGEFTNLIIESGGILYVGGRAIGAVGGKKGGGSTSGTAGYLQLTSDTSTITLKEQSTLYCYGFIYGGGKIEALSGSNIYEFFQINDFRGGSATTIYILAGGKKGFLFNKYYLQNIESRCVMYYGAVEYIVTGLVMNNKLYPMSAPFISKSGSTSGLFRLSENASIEKYYDGTTDRLIFKLLSGSATLSSLSLSLMGYSVNTKDYVLPINNNMSIVICEGAQVTIEQSACFLPGSDLEVEKGSTATISNSTDVIFYNKANWKANYTSNDIINDVVYSVTKTYKRTESDLKNASLNLNGTLNVLNGGTLLTTISSDTPSLNSVANIYSSNGSGKLYFNGTPGDSSDTYQWINGTSTDFDTIKTSPVYLRNSMNQEEMVEDTYVSLANETLTDSNYFFDVRSVKWLNQDAIIETKSITFIDTTFSLENYVMQFTPGQEFVFPTAEESGFIVEGQSLKKWKISNVGFFNPGDTYTFNDNIDYTVYAIWGGRSELSGTYYYVDYNTGDFKTGLCKLESYIPGDSEIHIYKFDDTGKFDIGFSGTYFYQSDNKTYLLLNGIVQESGLIQYQDNNQIGTNDFSYFYAQQDNSLIVSSTDDYLRAYIKTNLNDILPSGFYYFDRSGKIIKEDTNSSHYNQQIYIYNIDNQGDATYIDGIRVSYGLFEYNGYYYYSDINGNIVKNKTYYVSNVNKTNIQAGLYYFDEQGRMYDNNFQLIEIGAK